MPPVPPGAGWVTYVRCHDDIGWAITRGGCGARWGRTGTCIAGSWRTSTPGTSRARLLAVRGSSSTSAPARRARAGPRRRWPASRRRSERATRSRDELAIRRILLLYAVAFAHGGLPLIYMGDELGLRNDRAWAADPARRDDNRWMHRPPMDWEAAARRHDPASVEGRLWAGLRRLIDARRATRAVHAQGDGRADLDRQRPRLRPLARARRPPAAAAGELHPGATAGGARTGLRARPRARAVARARRPGPVRAGRASSCSSPTSTPGWSAPRDSPR